MLWCERGRLIEEVIVAIDQHPRGLHRDHPGEIVGGNFGKIEMFGSFDVQPLIFVVAARIEDNRPGLRSHVEELLLGHPAFHAQPANFTGFREKRFIINQAIRNSVGLGICRATEKSSAIRRAGLRV